MMHEDVELHGSAGGIARWLDINMCVALAEPLPLRRVPASTQYLQAAISSHPHTKMMVIFVFMIVAFHNLTCLVSYYLPFQVSLDSKNPAIFQDFSFLLLISLNIPGRKKGKSLISSRYPCVPLKSAIFNRWKIRRLL